MDTHTRGTFLIEDGVGFEERLRQAASKIRIAAKGRCCGECSHARLNAGGSGYCSENVNIDGNAVVILYRNAPACGQKFEPLCDS